jgi:urease subunit gamma/beta
VHLTPTERDRLLLFSAAELARRRRADGVLLNVPEATALIADEVCEAARRGGRHEDAVRTGQSVLSVAEVMPEVPYVVRSVAVEAVFADGSRLVVVDEPFGSVPERADMPGAVISDETADPDAHPDPSGTAVDRRTVRVENTAAIPISVTSHFHFFEVNPRLRFARTDSYGMHLDIPAGTHVRFDPGTVTEVTVVPILGDRVVVGFAGLVDGPLDEPGVRDAALARARDWGFLDSDSDLSTDPSAAAARAVAHAHETTP